MYSGKKLNDQINDARDNLVYAIELLKQLTFCSKKTCKNDLLVIIESADMLFPVGNIASLSNADRRRIGITQDWFSDPQFSNGNDTVIMFSESRSLIHPLIANLPQIKHIDIPLPNTEERKNYLTYKLAAMKKDFIDVSDSTAGLSIYALNQLANESDLSEKNICEKVKEFVLSQLGEDVIEFYQPTHTLEDVVDLGDGLCWTNRRRQNFHCLWLGC
jgi:hypothetical protein